MYIIFEYKGLKIVIKISMQCVYKSAVHSGKLTFSPLHWRIKVKDTVDATCIYISWFQESQDLRNPNHLLIKPHKYTL